MDFLIWLGMFVSGVGICMGRRMGNQLLPIQPDRPQTRMVIVFYVVAVGTAWQRPHGVLTATTKARKWGATVMGFVVSGDFSFALLPFNTFEPERKELEHDARNQTW